MGWVRLDLVGDETLRCAKCDMFITGQSLYLFSNGKETEEVLCAACWSKREVKE